MPMKLLPKSDILAAKADEQRQKADEGARIARRVDAVRDTLAREEKTLEEFRRRKVSEIDAQITARRTERDTLKNEVSQLAKQRKELQKPLDREWEEVKKARLKAEDEAANARIMLAEAHREGKEAKDAIRKAGDALARALAKEEIWREKLESACQADELAQGRLRHATEIQEDAEEMRRLMEAELARRDEDSAVRERGVTMREANLEAGESELAQGWKLLEDRKAAFERRITRAKQ
jgi:hypothetical protein